MMRPSSHETVVHTLTLLKLPMQATCLLFAGYPAHMQRECRIAFHIRRDAQASCGDQGPARCTHVLPSHAG